MENLPKNALSNVAVYLQNGTRALLAVALTAPSSSWNEWDSTKAPSRASKIVMSSPYYKDWDRNALYEEKWEELNLLGLDDSLLGKLTDSDVCGILVCIDARTNLKKLWLSRCVNVRGHGLAPLRDLTSLEVIDLSLAYRGESPTMDPEPMLSEDAVLPILQSNLGNNENSIKHLILPKTWREKRTEALGHFLQTYNRVLNSRNLRCSNCDGICVGTNKKPWMPQGSTDYGVQNFTCYECENWFCQECDSESDHVIQFCPHCEGKYCNRCAETCSKCNTTACGCCKGFDTCDICEKSRCGDCPGYGSDPFTFYRDACEQTICKNCCPRVECQNGSCLSSNCKDCVFNEIDTECVKVCKHCGEGFCTRCKPMQYCFHIGGFVCLNCQCKNHDIIECYWQALPPKLREIVPTFATEVTMDNLMRFWMLCIQLIGTDREFDQVAYKKSYQAEMASNIIAAAFLLKGEDNEAAYMLHYGGAMREIRKRGPDYIRKLCTEKSNISTEKLFCIHLDMFHEMIVNTASRASIAGYIENQEILGSKAHKMLSKVKKSECIIHCMESISDDEYKKEISYVYGESMEMDITISNKDSGFIYEWSVYKNCTLSWLLKDHVMECNYFSLLRSPKVTPSTKYFRVLHQERTIFLSSSGKKTLRELGIQDGDVIMVGGVDVGDQNNVKSSVCAKASMSKKSKKSSKSKKTRKSPKARPSLHTQSLTEDQLMEKYREAHSQSLSPVLGELKPVLKDIRNRLNDMMLQKSAPKAKKLRPRKEKINPRIHH